MYVAPVSRLWRSHSSDSITSIRPTRRSRILSYSAITVSSSVGNPISRRAASIVPGSIIFQYLLLEVVVLPRHLRDIFLREPRCLRVTALQLFKIRPVRLFHLLSECAFCLFVVGSHGLPANDPQKHRSINQDHHPDAA